MTTAGTSCTANNDMSTCQIHVPNSSNMIISMISYYYAQRRCGIVQRFTNLEWHCIA